MLNSAFRKGFSVVPKVQTNLLKEKMAAPNNATYVLEESHAGLPNSVVYQKVGTADSPTFTDTTISNLTLGSIVFAGTDGLLSQDNDKLFWDAVNIRFGIGTNSPQNFCHIKDSARLHCVIERGDVSGTSGPFVSLGFKLTTTGDMTAGFGPVQVLMIEDSAGTEREIAFSGGVRETADNNGAFVIGTALSGSLVEKVRVTRFGDLCVGVTEALGRAHIDQDSSTGAIPVLYLDQADVSEEMFQFETTIGTGNAIEAIGAKTLTSTHFIKITIPGGLTRYIPCGTIA